jgi:hypothetical protein
MFLFQKIRQACFYSAKVALDFSANPSGISKFFSRMVLGRAQNVMTNCFNYTNNAWK